MADPVKAWAVVTEKGGIYVNSIGDNPEFAKHAWLTITCMQYHLAAAPPEDIEFAWQHYAGPMKASVREVIISMLDA